MIIFKTANELSNYLLKQKERGKKIGFVPTMGALHKGHISLVRQANTANDLCVCSIFINPTQFNNQNDFNLYPVTIEKDIEHLLENDCSVLFLPTLKEIYPKDYQAKHFELGRIEQLLEGQFRPGHFQGVCQVVDRLLEIIHPDNLYLGQKDYQQCMVVNRLLELTERKNEVALHMAPTVREESGLAMSSRNMRLNDGQLDKAKLIAKILFTIKENLPAATTIAELKNQASKQLEAAGFLVDYIEIVNAKTLESASDKNEPLIAIVAAYINEVRLIDNLLLN